MISVTVDQAEVLQRAARQAQAITVGSRCVDLNPKLGHRIGTPESMVVNQEAVTDVVPRVAARLLHHPQDLWVVTCAGNSMYGIASKMAMQKGR